MARNCNKCGSLAPENAKFCIACGNALEALPSSTSAQHALNAARSQPMAQPAAQPAKTKSAAKAFLLTLLGVLAVLLLAGIGGVVYIGYLGKKKFDEIKGKVEQEVNQTKRQNAGETRGTAADSAPFSYPEWKPPADGSQPFSDGKIPLRPGVVVVTAVAHPLVGDYESLKSVESVTDDAIRISYSADMPSDEASGNMRQNQQPAPGTRRKTCVRTVQEQDLENSHVYWENFCIGGNEESHAGTTAISASKLLLSELKTKGETSFQYQSSALVSGPPDASCTLKRVEAADLAVPVLVNGRRVQLPAVHASCQPDFRDEANFYFLDDAGNPLALAWQLGENKLQVIKITVPTETPQIEQALSENGRAEVYGIYFDFASASIRPESGPVLKEISGALTNNPQWKLSVEGHTDNVGGDAYNLELSNRRAAAVKQALVEHYGISSDRLTTRGFGSSQPKESNDTLEGRARNRRVELVRE